MCVADAAYGHRDSCGKNCAHFGTPKGVPYERSSPQALRRKLQCRMADWTAAFTYAFRTLRRQPTFVLVAVLTLALGIGANTAIFSVIKTVVLNPLPYEDPEKIAVLWEVNSDGNQGPVIG